MERGGERGGERAKNRRKREKYRNIEGISCELQPATERRVKRRERRMSTRRRNLGTRRSKQECERETSVET